MGQDGVHKQSPRHVTLRLFRQGDAAATYNLFYDAVHQGARAHYSARERQAWAGSERMPAGWCDRLATQHTVLAEMEGRVAGFMSLSQTDDGTGHIDMAFVLPKLMGTGIAGRLYLRQEAYATGRGLTRLTVDASRVARSFFAKQGWRVIAPRFVHRDGQQIENFQMEKLLNGFLPRDPL